MMSKTHDCDYIYMYVRQDCVSGGPSVRTSLSAALESQWEPPSCRTHSCILSFLTPGPSSESVSSDAGYNTELRIR